RSFSATVSICCLLGLDYYLAVLYCAYGDIRGFGGEEELLALPGTVGGLLEEADDVLPDGAEALLGAVVSHLLRPVGPSSRGGTGGGQLLLGDVDADVLRRIAVDLHRLLAALDLLDLLSQQLSVHDDADVGLAQVLLVPLGDGALAGPCEEVLHDAH